jgi:hypothetical protein
MKLCGAGAVWSRMERHNFFAVMDWHNHALNFEFFTMQVKWKDWEPHHFPSPESFKIMGPQSWYIFFFLQIFEMISV